MKRVVFLLALLFSLSALALEHSFRFTYHSTDAGDDTRYDCHYIKVQATKFLTAMKATDIEFFCRGGVFRNGWWPLEVRADFNLAPLAGTGTKMVEFESEASTPGCGINTRLLDEIIKVMPHVEVVEHHRCGWRSSQWYYKLAVGL